MSQSTNASPGRSEQAHRARAFDIRNFIAALLGIYGVILLLTGLVGTSDSEISRSEDINVNLWTGIALLVASAVLATWARLRPVIVSADSERDDGADSNTDAS